MPVMSCPACRSGRRETRNIVPGATGSGVRRCADPWHRADVPDAEVLTASQRLLDKYFHPSRGGVPALAVAASLTDAKALLGLAAVRAREEAGRA
jgi:hypothetical protein